MLAEKLGVRSKVHFFSGRNDVSELMAAADLLMHPAYQEAAGIVLLEAIAAGLPVLTTAVCGYAHYITDANCGTVIAEPFSREQLNDVLRKALTQSPLRMAWRRMLGITPILRIYTACRRKRQISLQVV